MMVARARVWAERDEGTPEPTFRASGSEAAAPRARASATPAIRLSSAADLGAFYSFDHGLDNWSAPRNEHGAALVWEARGGGGCLRLENPHTGGDVAVPFPVSSFDARQWPCLAFDCRLRPGTRLNLYFRAFGGWHVVGLTGPTDADMHQVTESRQISGRLTAVAGLQLEEPPPVRLGQIAVTADDTWQEAEFGLLEALQRRYPGAAEYRVSDLHVGNWSNRGYLQCGFGGNHCGTLGYLDNIFLGRTFRTPPEISWQADQERAPEGGWAWLTDRDAETAAPMSGYTGRDRLRLPELASGWWYLHVFQAPQKGMAPAVRHQRFRIDALPPAVLSADPADAATGAPETLRLSLSEPGGSGIDPESIVLTVAGQAISGMTLTPKHTPERQELAAPLTGLEFADGQSVPCTLTLCDRAGNRLQEYAWEWTFARNADRTPPSLPRLTQPPPSGWDDDVEAVSPEWQPFPGSAWTELSLDDTTGSAGPRSLRVRGGPGPYTCIVRQQPFDLGTRPLLALDYRATPESVWDLALQTDKGWWVVAVNGGTQQWPVVGRLPSYRPDAQWHTALLPLEDWLRARNGFVVPVVRAMAVTATRMNGGQKTELHLDAFRLVPAVAIRPGAALVWSATDVSGVGAFATLLDRNAGTEPLPAAARPEAVLDLASASPGLVHLHVRAQDKAGNWADTLHQPILLRPGHGRPGPKITRLTPAPGERAAADVVRVEVDGGPLSPESVRFAVAERTYTFADSAVRFDPGGRAIEFHAPRANPGAAAWQDGEVVSCRVALSDDAGQSLPEPFAWSWTMDAASDRMPPPAPYVTWRPQDVFLRADFDDGIGQCIGLREGWSECRRESPATGLQCVRFGGFSTFLCYVRFDVGRFPMLGFEYRVPPGGQFYLILRIENRNWEIRLNSDAAKYPLIGRVEGIVADGQWHSCRVNLAEMLAKAPIPPRGTLVDHVGTLNKAGECFLADDMYLGPATDATIRVRWSVPRDASGIRGYSVAVDTTPDTVPDGSIDTTVPEQTLRLSDGPLHYVHVRAIDGAGNAGATAHAEIRQAAP